MNIDFALILVLAALVTGLVWLLDILLFRQRREESGAAREPVLVEYARSFFPIIMVVLVVRSFLYDCRRQSTCWISGVVWEFSPVSLLSSILTFNLSGLIDLLGQLKWHKPKRKNGFFQMCNFA